MRSVFLALSLCMMTMITDVEVTGIVLLREYICNCKSAKCKFYTERIALASSSKELHQIVNILSNKHPPKTLPTIYPSADLPNILSNTLPTK